MHLSSGASQRAVARRRRPRWISLMRAISLIAFIDMPSINRPRRALPCGRRLATRLGALGAGLALCLLSLVAVTQPASGAASAIDPSTLTASGRILVKRDGTVINSRYVRGSIDVRADNVTIINTIVDYSGYHSIRIYPDADGTRIINTKVLCRAYRTNGVMPGNYIADRVDLEGCRNDFMFSGSRPATITNSTIDGVPYSNVGGPSSIVTATPTPTAAPTSTATAEPTRRPSPTASAEPTRRPTATASAEPTRRPTATASAEPTRSPTATASVEPTRSPTATASVEPTRSPTATASVEPTRSPTATASVEPTRSPTATAPTGFVNAVTTGVPAGLSLRSSGSLTITRAGTVIDGLHVRGTITVEADNVTIRNTLIQAATDGYPIMVTGGVTGTRIERVEVDNLNSTGIGIYFQGGSGTVRYANIHSAEDGIRIEADNVVVENSYIHDLFRHPGGHHDTIQIRRGDNVSIRNNNLQIYNATTDDPMNAAIQIGSLIGTNRISNFQVTGNLMNGGNFTINGGGRGEVDSAVYSNNRFGRDFRYGVAGNLENSTWESTNLYLDTGALAR